jgi:sorbitol-specific phosphotransferase system component IIA
MGGIAALSYGRRKFTDARPQAPVKELGKRAIPNWLELSHVDVIFADKGLDFARAPARILVERIQPVIERPGLDPLR